MKIFKLFLIACLFTLTAQAQKKYELASPDGKLKTNITAGKQLTYDIVFNGQQVIAAAPISITLENGEVWGENDKPTSAKRKSVSEKVASPFYRAAEMEDNYNQLVLSFKGNWSVEFRAYNDGIAYRFVSKSKKPFNIANEEVNFQFNSDAKGTVPFVIRGSDGNYESQFFNSFENQYTVKKLSELNKKRLIFLPALAEMKTLIVYYHPYDESYCNAILKAVQEGLKKGGYPYKTIDLLLDSFDPVMYAKDLEAFAVYGRTGDITQSDVDPLVLDYKKKLEWAERIVMIFPIWWMNVPAMVKGFIDKVIFPGVAYKMEGSQLVSRLHSLRQVVIISTMNTPSDVYREKFNNSLEGSLVKGTFNQIGIHDVQWVSINMVKQSGPEMRKLWLEEIEERFER